MMMKWKRSLSVVVPLALAASLFGAPHPAAAEDEDGHRFAAQPGCRFANGIKYVVNITFDNVHLRRDNPNVPSDLEQIPSLLNFLADHGTLGSNHHTALISHTATGVLIAISGLYGDRMGMPVSNSYRVFGADGHISVVHGAPTDAVPSDR